MPTSLPDLEFERSKILDEFLSLGDLRPGSICAVSRRCGRPNCHCAKPNDPGHDPQVRLTRKIEGKTVAESFPTPAAWRKAQFCSSVLASSKPAARPSSAPVSSGPACSGPSRAPTPFLALRCCDLNGRFEDYWEARRAA